MTTLEVRGLRKHFPGERASLWSRRRRIEAVDDVSFALHAGRITALVGESGSGKSTLARLIARLQAPTDGSVLFEGRDVTRRMGRRQTLRYRSQLQLIFQDPFGSLNPVRTVEHHLARPLRIHKVVPRSRVRARVRELLASVGLVPPDDVAAKYPHELSGGQRQRVAIARALAVEPRVLLADEPISMLDVSIRIGILNLMRKLKEERRLALLYITHDIASARYAADEILVMYAGRIVEQGPTEDVLASPLHPYTRMLLAAAPGAPGERRPAVASRRRLGVDVATGCRFVDRCPLAVEVCSRLQPPLVEARPRHAARCHVTAPASS